jgi:hypothetical protein
MRNVLELLDTKIEKNREMLKMQDPPISYEKIREIALRHKVLGLQNKDD